MIYSNHCYNRQWRQQMCANHIQTVTTFKQFKSNAINTAEDLLAADLEGDELSESFAELSLEDQERFLDLLENDCPWPIIGLEH